MRENEIRKGAVGVLAALFLGSGVALWLLGLRNHEGITLYYSLCWKLGPVLFLWWLAWEQIRKIPRWAYIFVPLVLIAMVVNRRLLLVVVPIALVLALLNHPWVSRSERKKRR